MLVFFGADAINAYTVTLRDYSFLLWAARFGLVIIFLIHLGLGLQLTLENRRARPKSYAYQNTVQASLASRSMALTGLVMLSYIVYHLMHFTLGVVHSQYYHLKDHLGRSDVYSMIVLSFQEPAITIAYMVSLFATFAHLSHGIPSLFQSLGWNAPAFHRYIRITGLSCAVVLFLGYSSIPISIYTGIAKIALVTNTNGSHRESVAILCNTGCVAPIFLPFSLNTLRSVQNESKFKLSLKLASAEKPPRIDVVFQHYL